MHVVRTKITNLEAQVEGLKKSEADFRDRYEEAQSHRECVEVDLSAQIISKYRDLAGKDAEIANLKRRLHEAQEGLEAEKKILEAERQKTDSLEINLVAEKVKAEVSLAALNVALENYAEVQSTVESLLSDCEWMQNFGIAHITSSILNATELDKVVVALTMVARAAGHRVGYLECAKHVEEALHQHFGSRRYSAREGAEDGLRRAKEDYNSLSIPVLDVITEALKHDDYVASLRSFFEPPETVELSDEEDFSRDDEGAE
ncbi:hypothetical protein HanXRQr2_Chr17g0813951 [Helianthus annuus]|uniref:Uncharacterized protein n=1 Tax=Helianthus annuus TaxID=4232 RepID=A0A9K3DKI6_HELAN|nr:hypothetical protein HanXRQr2_Chr17g0813951 [Helianthus annuus]KAJ0429892.1 hypothetical protein HanHA300_Chr17g0662641 [Helianthus annuus]KAJ0815611.1 hypothetical protein HanLR1_Chr00c0700g0768571 [Helianthus annuus]